MIFFALGIAVGAAPLPTWAQIPLVIMFVGSYALYVRRTLREGGDVQEREDIGPLIMDRTPAQDDPKLHLIVIQLVAGLAAIVGGAHLFVEELLHVAEDIGIEPLVLSLILAPLATELPEKANSFFWVRDGKDALALGNITGAMVFQSTIPIAIGLLLTEWDLDRFAIVSGCLGLVGGAIAYYEVHGKSRFSLWAILAWIGLFIAFLFYVLAS